MLHYCWCKRENVEPGALKDLTINNFKIIDTRVSFYSLNTNLLPAKSISSFHHLKRGIQEFHMKYAMVPADKATINVVVVRAPPRYFLGLSVHLSVCPSARCLGHSNLVISYQIS